MNRWTAAIVAILAVILASTGGMILGAVVGNLIVPARLDWSAQSGPGLLIVGAIVGLLAGFGYGIHAAMRIVDGAADSRARSGRPR
jgi:F0F1-type ATP synthase assembly protein I